MRRKRVHKRGHQLEVRLKRFRGQLGVARRRKHDEVGDQVYLGFGPREGGVGDHRRDGRDDQVE